jgi:isopentenyl-diphosphate Delta-isomerase
MTQMKERKADHIDICLNERTAPGYCYWDDIKLIHDALPELDPDDIDTTADVMGRKLEFPFIVTAITGGFSGAKKINANIASACADLGIGMGIGSQRAAVEGIDTESYSVIKDYDVPLVIGNVGAPQLISQHGKEKFTAEKVGIAKDLIDADFMAVHLNFLQEVVQPEGDTNSKGCLEAIRSLAREYPIIVKETGAGISRRTAQKLKGIGIQGLDVAGMGGTSFAAVELYRAMKAKDDTRIGLGETFFDWGIPAPVCLKTADVGLPMIASGGIFTGLHAAGAIALGATCAGGASVVLKEASESADAVKKKLLLIKEEIRAAMLLTGSADMKQLSETQYVVLGETREWMADLS